MTAPHMVTPSMQTKAEALAALVPTFHRGRSKRTGESFVIFPGSVPTVAHWATSYGCTCKGFDRRGTCTHSLAVSISEQLAPITLDDGDRILLARLIAEQAAQRRMLLLTGWQADELDQEPVYAQRAGYIERLQARREAVA